MSDKNRERIASAVQAAFETMETRRLLSTVVVTDGVLVIDADPRTASNIIVDLHAPGGRIRGYCAGVEATFAASEVRAVRITGSDADDSVFIDKAIKLPTLIRTGAGNDRVRGGRGVDTVDAGAGNDTVYGSRGNDRLSGGDGNDMIHGNVGHDIIDGGAADDRIYGQDGNDTLYGGEGFDLLAGQRGDDTIYGGEGDDRLGGGTGADDLYGGVGNDKLEGHSGNDELFGGDGSDKTKGGNGRNTVRSGGSNGEHTAQNLTESLEIDAPVSENPTPPPQDPVDPDSVDPDNGNTGGDDTTAGERPNPVIRMIGDADRLIGSAVHVHGLASDLNGGTLLNSRFEWDFGDPSGRYNNLPGFNAAHVYDQPGVYTIKLTVTNERGRSAVTTVQVNVSAETRAAIYVDSARGNDDNDGSTPERAVRSAEKAFELAGDDTRVLFKRGQRFVIRTTLVIKEDRVLVGAYGTGNLPELYKVEGAGDAVFRTTSAAEDVTIEDLRIDSEYKANPNGAVPKIPVTGVYAGGTNITVRDIEFGDVGNGVNANQAPTGLLVQDTEVTTSYGMRSYHIWGEGTDLVILGNKSVNSTREHNLRTTRVERILVAYNDFGQLDRKAVDPGDIEKGAIEIHRGIYSYIARNIARGGLIRLGPRGGGWEAPDTATDWSVIEDNYSDDEGIHLYPGTHHVVIRNNVIERYRSRKWGASIVINPAQMDHRVSSDIYILNNTVIDRRPTGIFLRTYGMEWGNQITLKNNLWVNENFQPGKAGSAAVYVTENNLRSFREISGNVWALPGSPSGAWAKDGVSYLAATWGDKDGYVTAAEWNANPAVGTDYFANVTLGDLYQVTLNGTTAGSSLRRAA